MHAYRTPVEVVDATVDLEPAPTERLLDVNGLADKLAFKNDRSIYRLHDAGVLPPAIRFGTSLRWREATIDAWIRHLDGQATA